MSSNNKQNNLLDEPLKVVNIGLKIFYESLSVQGVEVVHIDWKPPVGGDEKLAKILNKLL